MANNLGAIVMTTNTAKMVTFSEFSLAVMCDLLPEPNRHFRDIPLKVCKSPTDCSPGGLVTKDQSFALEDQIGHVKDAKGTKGWVSALLLMC